MKKEGIKKQDRSSEENFKRRGKFLKEVFPPLHKEGAFVKKCFLHYVERGPS